MQAITQRTYGSPDVLTLTDLPRPTVGAKDVLVAVHATAVTQGDRRLRAGAFPGVTWLPGRLAMGITGPRKPVTGTMFSGRVVAIGDEVSRFAVGDDVFGSVGHGAHAEEVVVAEGGPVARIPAGWSHDDAAAIPYGAVTALHFLRDLAAVKPGDRVCVLGASGGVGRYAVQLAKHLGAHVTAVSRAEHHDLTRSLGADAVVDREREDFRDQGAPYDVILDTVGASSFGRSRRALTATGRYLSLIVTVGLLMQQLFTKLFGRRRARAGIAMGGRQDMEDVAALAAAGVFRPVVAARFPLASVADAHAAVETGRVRGDVVLQVAAPQAA